MNVIVMWGEIFAQVCYEMQRCTCAYPHGTCRGESEAYAVKGQCFQKSLKDEEFIYLTFESQNHRITEMTNLERPGNCLLYIARLTRLACRSLACEVDHFIVLAIIYIKIPF